MINNFLYEPTTGLVEWDCSTRRVSKTFKGNIQVELMNSENKVLVVADAKEVGSDNLFIFDEAGNVVLNPKMPKLSKSVKGVYSIWYVKGSKEHTAILLSDEFSPYDTACKFNVENGEFSEFHATK